MSEPADALDRLRLARTPSIGSITYHRLLARHGSAAAALASLPGLAAAAGRAAAPTPPPRPAIERELDAMREMGATLIFAGLPPYPETLASLDDAPPCLAAIGDTAHLAGRAVAIVGARNASANGQRIAEALGADLAGAGLVVVSGLARGIDTAAHRGALSVGPTIAVIAGGLDRPYPPENAALQDDIARHGLVLSERPLGASPRGTDFPRRNRVVAGLSLGVVVVEAAPRSGSLITARLAQEAGRELFAVPGSPLDPRCQGSNDLIRQGAHLTEGAPDVLAHLPDWPGEHPGLSTPWHPAPASPVEPRARPPLIDPESDRNLQREILALLGHSPVTVDDLCRRCQLPAAAVLAAVLELELAGRVSSLPGHRVCLASEAPRGG